MTSLLSSNNTARLFTTDFHDWSHMEHVFAVHDRILYAIAVVGVLALIGWVWAMVKMLRLK